MSTPDTLTAWVLAAAVEEELIRVEVEQGYNVAFATRPLTRDERAAKTKFPDLDAIVTITTEDGLGVIDVLYAAAIAGLIEEVFGTEEEGAEDTVEVAAITAILLLMMSRPSRRYKKESQKAGREFSRLMGVAYTGGVATIMDEAARQGIDITGWPKPTAPATLGALADDIAGHPWRRVVERATNEYTKPNHVLTGTVTREEFEQFIEATGRDGTRDQLHQGNQAAMGMGRIDAAENYAGGFAYAVASEVLDGNTCGPCSSVDGKRYDTIEEARADYPNGTYTNCLGGARCRGVLVIVYRPDEE